MPARTKEFSPPEPRLPARLAAGVVRFYQIALSPLQRLFGPAAGCRFAPSCSEYSRQSYLTHGVMRGSWLTLCRLLRCQPFCAGGHDPVPPARYVAGRMWRPRVES